MYELNDSLSLEEFPLYSLSFVVVSCVPLVTNTYEITACCLCRADGFIGPALYVMGAGCRV